MRKLIAIGALLAAWFALPLTAVFAQTNIIGGGLRGDAKAPSGGGACAQYTAFATRATAAGSTLTGSDITNYTNLICGMVTNGTFAKKEGFYNLAAPNTTLALLDLTANAHNLTLIGSPTFSAYHGYTGGVGIALDTGVTLSTGGGIFTLNSAIVGGWSNTSLTSSNQFIGAVDGSGNVVLIQPQTASFQASYSVNETGSAAVSVSGSIGHYVANRNASTGTTSVQGYKYGVNQSVSAGNSTALPTTHMMLLALGFTGGVSVNNWPGQLSFGYFGSSHTATDVANDCHTLNVYLTAVNGNAAVC